jgi:hypothetical protein
MVKECREFRGEAEGGWWGCEANRLPCRLSYGSDLEVGKAEILLRQPSERGPDSAVLQSFAGELGVCRSPALSSTRPAL